MADKNLPKSTIVLVLLKDKRSAFYPPLSLLYVGGALKKNGFDVRIYDIFPDEMGNSVKEILGIKPLFVGFSVMTGSSILYAAFMSRVFKKNGLVNVWGGIHPSCDAAGCLREEFIDYVVIGEGEEAIVELAETLYRGESAIGIVGVGYKGANDVVVNPRREFIKNLDDFFPDFSLVDVDDYIFKIADGSRIMSFITSRGCPYGCKFCYNQEFNKNRWRCHSIEFVVDLINKMADEHGLRGVTFDDDNFFVNKERAFKILEGIKVPPYFLDVRLDYIDEDFMERLEKIGCKWLFFGWESGSDRILKLVNKGFDVRLIKEKIGLLAKYPSIIARTNAIMGYPTETWEEIKATIRLALKLNKMHPNMDIGIGLFVPYPGTELYQLALRHGFNVPKKIEEWSKFDVFFGENKLEWLSWVDSKKLKKIKKMEYYAGLLDTSHLQTHPFLVRFLKSLLNIWARIRLRMLLWF